MNEENHLLYIYKKQAKSIQRFEIDMLGRSRESFSDFDAIVYDSCFELEEHKTKRLENKIQDGIDNLR